jgi:aspartate aminotransferase/aminotransferase
VIDVSQNHYIDTLGYAPLRKKISMYYKQYQVELGIDNILITAGAKLGVLEALMAIKSKKGALYKVGYFEPAWVSYSQQISMVSAEPISFDISEFESLHDSNLIGIDCLIINNPHNPSGKLYSSSDIKKISYICSRLGIAIIFDEVYSEFTTEDFYTGAQLLKSLGNLDIVIVNSLSKNFGMSGWRIGYCLVSDSLKQDLINIHQHSLTCASVPIQNILNVEFDRIVSITRPQIKKILEKRIAVVNYLKKLNFNMLSGNSTFYIFATHPDIVDVDKIFDNLLDEGVAIVPGSGYGKRYRSYMRISIGVEPLERICNAIDIIESVIAQSKLHSEF